MISHHWNRPQPDRQPHRNSVPSVARVRNHSARTQHITRSFVMTLNAFWCFFILRFHVAGPCPSLRTSTFSRKQRSLWVRPAASMPHSHCSCHVCNVGLVCNCRVTPSACTRSSMYFRLVEALKNYENCTSLDCDPTC